MWVASRAGKVSHFLIKQRAPQGEDFVPKLRLLRPGKDLRQLALAFHRLFGFRFRAVNQTKSKLGELISEDIRY